MDARTANTDELKALIKALGDTAHLVAEVSKGFSFSEIADGYALSQEAQALFKQANLLLPTWEQMDDAARADLVAFANANIKLPENVQVEGYVKKVLASAIALSAVVAPWLS